MAGISSDLPLIAVCGATGVQGGSLINILLDTKKIRIRALTRNPDGEKGKLLLGMGCEVVKVDFDEKLSIKPAFEGCHGAFLTTNLREHMDPEKEYNQGVSLADGVKAAGVKHVIWSTFEDTRLFKDDIPYIGKYKVPHFDEKGRVDEYMKSIGIPVTFYYPTINWEAFITAFRPKKQEDGSYSIVLPLGDVPLPGITNADMGKGPAAIFLKGLGEAGEKIGVASDHLKISEIAKCLSEVSGCQVKYVPIEPQAFRESGFPGAHDGGNTLQFIRDHNKEFCEVRNMERVRSLFEPTKFKDFCIANYKQMLQL